MQKRTKKIGVTINKSVRTKPSMRSADGDVIAEIDGITFGVTDGYPVDLFGHTVTNEYKIKWATMQASFLRDIAKKLDQYVNAITIL